MLPIFPFQHSYPKAFEPEQQGHSQNIPWYPALLWRQPSQVLLQLCLSAVHYIQTLIHLEVKQTKVQKFYAYIRPYLFFKKLKSKDSIVKLTVLVTFTFIILGLDYDSAFAVEQTTQSLDFPSTVLAELEEASKAWGPIIEGFSLSLFKWLIQIEIGLFAIRAILSGQELKQTFAEFTLLIFYSCFMVAIIYNHEEWTTALINSFSNVAIKTGAPEPSPQNIFTYGLIIIGNLLNNFSLIDIPVSIGVLFSSLVIAVTFTLITAQIIMVKCEAYIVLNAGAILLGFGGSKITKEYAINFLRYALSVAVKLFVLQLLMGMSMSFIMKFSSVNTKSFADIFIVICSSILILALVKSIPDIVSGIVNGSHVSTGSALTSAVSAVGIASMAVGRAPAQAMGGAVEAKRGFNAAQEAFSMAGSQGATGFAKGMQAMKNLGGAMRDNIGDSDMGNLRSSMVARHESFKMDQANSGPSNDYQFP
ncbi:P-type conjugative transfer protein TrbL [Desulfovibrio sp. JC010]|uniref:P-type conjugative transfer protein TrbL n=1 Tax=Desulfovibrio sp. JC010 TaxID=2593641 RepID=UPI0013D33230|nr:P-type conjugative transfer protein TrbL [Desulfovibrio sp. JC010]NDV26923.1 P-type conjugative transfer protein TrbL [Desulfovibrio sp. JC010]